MCTGTYIIRAAVQVTRFKCLHAAWCTSRNKQVQGAYLNIAYVKIDIFSAKTNSVNPPPPPPIRTNIVSKKTLIFTDGPLGEKAGRKETGTHTTAVSVYMNPRMEVRV